ncbi:MAG: hypothetical protein U5L96_11200 [Owenweeksia sp.]|nr:hypothetical protein [Owenweeksia sp.]
MAVKGQVLVRIDDLASWQAQLMRYKAELQNAEKDLERKKALSEVAGVTDAELETAQLKDTDPGSQSG